MNWPTFGLEIERFCNDVAGGFLLPANELTAFRIARGANLSTIAQSIAAFAAERHISSSMAAYRLHRADALSEETWRSLRDLFGAQWRRGRDAAREARKGSEGPNYYVVRRHRLGTALLRFASRSLAAGALSPTKAGQVLGVKPRSVRPLLSTLSGSTTPMA
jgi:Zn-dependent peptidase ImmA (M78 family)